MQGCGGGHEPIVYHKSGSKGGSRGERACHWAGQPLREKGARLSHAKPIWAGDAPGNLALTTDIISMSQYNLLFILPNDCCLCWTLPLGPAFSFCIPNVRILCWEISLPRAWEGFVQCSALVSSSHCMHPPLAGLICATLVDLCHAWRQPSGMPEKFMPDDGHPVRSMCGNLFHS